MPSPRPDETKIIDLGSGAFMDGNESVISYQGSNYYKACGAYVVGNIDEGGSTCVRREGHISFEHEDWDGTTRDIHSGSPVALTHHVRSSAAKVLAQSGLDPKQIFNALNALAQSGISLSKGT